MIRILFYLQLVSTHLNPDGISNLIGFSVLIPFLSFLSSFTASRSFILIVCILYVNLLLSSPEVHLFISGIISVLSISSNCFLMTFSANSRYFVRFQPIYYKLTYHSSICAKSFGLSPVLNATAHHSFLVFISLIGKSESLAISFQPNALTQQFPLTIFLKFRTASYSNQKFISNLCQLSQFYFQFSLWLQPVTLSFVFTNQFIYFCCIPLLPYNPFLIFFCFSFPLTSIYNSSHPLNITLFSFSFPRSKMKYHFGLPLIFNVYPVIVVVCFSFSLPHSPLPELSSKFISNLDNLLFITIDLAFLAY